MENNIQDIFETHNTRRKPQQQRSIDKLNRILDAATLLMANPSGEKITTSMIAKKAGIAVGSVYQFYSNIEEIKEAMLSRVLSRISLVYQRVIEDMPEGTKVSDTSDALIDATAEFANNYPVIVRVITASTYNKEFLIVKRKVDKIQLELFTKLVMRDRDQRDLREVRRWLGTLILLGDTMTYQVWTTKDKQRKERFIAEWKGLSRYYLDLQNAL